MDGAGNLAMTSTGYNVMGWQVDPETGDPKEDTVSALQVMNPDNLTYSAAATTDARVTGIIDKNDTSVNSSSGRIMNLEFYDNLGYLYTARLSIHGTGTEGGYYVTLDDILDSGTGESIGTEMYDLVDFGGEMQVTTSIPKSSSSTPVLDGTLDFTLGATSVTGQTIGNIVNGAIAPAGADITGAALAANPDLLGMYKDMDATVAAGINHAYIDAQGRLHVTDPANAAKSVYLLNSGVETKPNITTATINGVAFPTGEYTVDATGIKDPAGNPVTPEQISTAFNGYDPTTDGTNKFVIGNDGNITVTEKTVQKSINLTFNKETGLFDSVAGNTEGFVTLGLSGAHGKFSDISIDFSKTKNVNNGGSSTVGAAKGTSKGLGTGRKEGDMIGISIAKDGIITASYDNGMSKCLGQIATATFANASGLEKQGDNLYSATMNSGEFDGIGQDITTNGGYMQSGVLEMSNVDLSQEFTEMITTQRGFQANSRIITVSDTMLEELTNLKR